MQSTFTRLKSSQRSTPAPWLALSAIVHARSVHNHLLQRAKRFGAIRFIPYYTPSKHPIVTVRSATLIFVDFFQNRSLTGHLEAVLSGPRTALRNAALQGGYLCPTITGYLSIKSRYQYIEILAAPFRFWRENYTSAG